MQINLKARLRNKTFIISSVTLIIAFIYQLMSVVGIVPSVDENEVLSLCGMVVNILAFLGVLVDPTTKGINDSQRAMAYYNSFEGESVDNG